MLEGGERAPEAGSLFKAKWGKHPRKEKQSIRRPKLAVAVDCPPSSTVLQTELFCSAPFGVSGVFSVVHESLSRSVGGVIPSSGKQELQCHSGTRVLSYLSISGAASGASSTGQPCCHSSQSLELSRLERPRAAACCSTSESSRLAGCGTEGTNTLKALCQVITKQIPCPPPPPPGNACCVFPDSAPAVQSTPGNLRGPVIALELPGSLRGGQPPALISLELLVLDVGQWLSTSPLQAQRQDP
ncbi:hypothetical protein LEMLEM_LOCUS23001 [Lemmus lemmus]